MSNELTMFQNVERQMDILVRYNDFLAEAANNFAVSGLVPKSLQGKSDIETKAKVMVAIQFGLSVGFTPHQAVQNIAAINGKPAVYGDGVTALIQRHPDLQYIKPREFTMAEASENINKAPDMPSSCTIRFKRKSMAEEESITVYMRDYWSLFTDPDKAGTWGKYPKKMLYRKAMMELKELFSDAFLGIAVYEEEQEIPQEKEVMGRYQEVVNIPTVSIQAPPPAHEVRQPIEDAEGDKRQKAWEEGCRENYPYLTVEMIGTAETIKPAERKSWAKSVAAHVEAAKNIAALLAVEPQETRLETLALMIDSSKDFQAGEIQAFQELIS